MIKNKLTGDIVENNSIKIIDDSLEFEMLSQGNTAEVYLYGDTEILKLFREGMPFELIKGEYKIAEAVSSKLYNVPKVFGIVLYKDKIKSHLNSLPNGNSLCHFDFHPGNVIIKDNSFYVIDWMTACVGNANADVARTSLILEFGELQHVNPFIKAAAHIFEKHVGNNYHKEYKRIAGISDYNIEQWILPVAAARLVEWITASEKSKLLRLVREKLSLI